MILANFNPEDQFIEAEGFLGLEYKRGIIKDFSIDQRMACITAIVCQSLACELFLKCILNFLNVRVDHIHGLKDLFYKLPDKDSNGNDPKSIIKSLYLAKIQVFLNLISQTLPPGADVSNLKNFENILSTNDDNFIKWRYMYEWSPEDLNTNALCQLCFAIRDYILMIKPTLSEYIH